MLDLRHSIIGCEYISAYTLSTEFPCAQKKNLRLAVNVLPQYLSEIVLIRIADYNEFFSHIKKYIK